MQVRDWTGEFGPPHALPSGVVILANSQQETIDRCLEPPLEQLTQETITNIETIKEKMVQARSAGYIWCFEEFAEGINSVAAPVFGPDAVVGALQVHGPTFRFPNPDHTHDLGLLVADAAARLGELLAPS